MKTFTHSQTLSAFMFFMVACRGTSSLGGGDNPDGAAPGSETMGSGGLVRRAC